MTIENFEVSPGDDFEIEGVTVSINQDDLGWYMMTDDPMGVIGCDSWGRHWTVHAGGADVPDFETCKAIYNEEWQEIVERAAYDCEERASGVVVYPDWHDRAVTFKTWRNAAKGMLARVGVAMDDIKIETISPQYDQTGDRFYCIWSQSQLDKYAGCKNAVAQVEYAQSILSGDVWYITVSDKDEIAEYECSGGFVGEYWCDYIQDAAREMLEGVLAEKREKLATLAAIEMTNSRPDMYPTFAQ